ncbi:hypothetical protein FZEAL_5407 [Fusarium zealandicum]|uniref:Xylanolytic transcriptional activator regulatory domain-containing protein n=1 Tax=Fusarium zealandicum TaxID=1053134 RepID=A0A8H4UKM8_9HYPO|nr:hypothetical protein FZEAL_5407 [Fusarium zealandicum]
MLVSMSLAARLAYILRLNHENDKLPFLVSERRRRLMWSIFATDTLYSSGKREFTSCTAETLHIQLPCREQSFSMDLPGRTESLAATPASLGASRMGLHGYCLRVLDIRDRVQRLALAITNHSRPLEECLATLESVEAELQVFYSSLPSQYQLDTKGFSLRAFSASRTPYLMLHAWWHQTHCDLFRFTIPGFREGLPTAEISRMSPGFASACRQKCLAHAVAVSRILETPRLVGGAELISDPSLAMCAFHSARIISRLGQHPMGDMAQPELIARLTACAEALQEQSAVFPTTSILQKGILDLLNDAQRDRDGPCALPCIWDEEENESNPETLARVTDGVLGRGEIYSKHSVTDVVRNMNFESEDLDSGSSVAQETLGSVDGPGSWRIQESYSNSVGDASSPVQPQQHQTALGLAVPNAGLHTGYMRGGMDHEGSLLTLGFDPRYDLGQPDLFMDSFWPLEDGGWTLPDTNSQMQ